MEIISQYDTIGDISKFKKFICSLNSSVDLIVEITKEDKCKITFEDKISSITDICATISQDDLNGLIRTLRIISNEISKNLGNSSDNSICL